MIKVKGLDKQILHHDSLHPLYDLPALSHQRKGEKWKTIE